MGDKAPTDLPRLIQDCIAGKPAAQKQLYDRYAPMVYGIIRRYISQDAAAKEILNDSFYKILTRLDSYGFKGAFEGWMRTIAVYTITDHVRKNLKHEKALQPLPEYFDVGAPQDITAHLSYKQLLLLIHELPDTQRAVFNLHVLESYAHKEIAAMLDISEINSRWHLNDARRRLKEKIKSLT